MNHSIVNRDLYLPPIALNQPISTLLGLNLPHPYPRPFSDQIVPPLFLENSFDIQNILLQGNYVKIPSFPQQGREDAQSATSSTEWIDTEEKPPIDLKQVNRIMEKSAVSKVFSPGTGEEYITKEPINFECFKLLSQVQSEDRRKTLGISQFSKKIKKHSQPINPNNSTDKEKSALPTKNKLSLDTVKKIRYGKLRTKRNPWRPLEDTKLLDLVQVYGESWAMISSKLPNRTGKQIRDRYLNILRPNLKKGEWTAQEDNLLVALSHQIGHKWSSIAKHMPGRSEAQVKNRFYSNIKKKIEGGKGDDVHIPRLEPSSSASFPAESTEMEYDGSRRWVEEEREESSAEMSVKVEENEKKKAKLENGWEPKIEAEDTRMETEPRMHPRLARKIHRLRELNGNGGLEGRPGRLLAETNMQKTVKNVGGSEDMPVGKTQAGSRGPINEKEVDLVIEILARYYQNQNAREEINREENNENFMMDTVNKDINKTNRLRQLDVRKAHLELLLIKTMEEMDKIQNK